MGDVLQRAGADQDLQAPVLSEKLVGQHVDEDYYEHCGEKHGIEKPLHGFVGVLLEHLDAVALPVTEELLQDLENVRHD